RAINLVLPAADDVRHTVHDDLRRIDPAIAPGVCIRSLPACELWAGEGVLPAEVIPVVDRERQCHDVRPFRIAAQKSVCCWARRAALAGEELESGYGAIILGRCGRGRTGYETGRYQTQKRGQPAIHVDPCRLFRAELINSCDLDCQSRMGELRVFLHALVEKRAGCTAGPFSSHAAARLRST